MVEYAKDKIIAFIRERNLLIINDWQVIKLMEEQDLSNTNKYWMRPIPGFHETEFPFIICNGWEHFSIINVRDFTIEKLIQASSKTGLSQEAAFFLDTEYGFIMHFASQHISAMGKRLQFWHTMAFRQDFIQTLTKYGGLPISSSRG